MWFRTPFGSVTTRSTPAPARGAPRRPSRPRLCVETLEGRSLPSFSAPVSYAVGSAPGALTPADFNGDGRSDLATANYGSGTVSVLRGNGDGTFRAAVGIDTFSGTSLALGDVNGDGRADLLLTYLVWDSGPLDEYLTNHGTLDVRISNGDG